MNLKVCMNGLHDGQRMILIINQIEYFYACDKHSLFFCWSDSERNKNSFFFNLINNNFSNKIFKRLMFRLFFNHDIKKDY